MLMVKIIAICCEQQCIMIYTSVDIQEEILQQPTLRDHGLGLVYHAMCLFTPRLSLGTHRTYPQRDMAQAELTWVPGSAPRWFTRPKTVTHPGTNQLVTTEPNRHNVCQVNCR